MVDKEELINILRLINTDGIGPVGFYGYVNKAGNIADSLELAQNKKDLCSRSFALEELDKAEENGVEIISYKDVRYPAKLRQLNDAPPIIYALGNTELLQYPEAISVVGARNASIGGRKIASRIAYDLTENNVLIISGMARGIDSAAHKGALYAKGQHGATIAVLGTGVDMVYPSENVDLYRNIVRQGLIISEFPLGTAAQINNFPRRNRIISALSDGTLVVEAGLHSGSLITAKLALEQGKDVFAVPGSPLESRSVGPNHLIKEGAILTENAEDILSVLSISSAQQIKNRQFELLPLDKEQNKVNIPQQVKTFDEPAEDIRLLELISYEGVDIDELLRSSKLAQDDFFAELLDLEFSGKIERHAGNKVARIK